MRPLTRAEAWRLAGLFLVLFWTLLAAIFLH